MDQSGTSHYAIQQRRRWSFNSAASLQQTSLITNVVAGFARREMPKMMVIVGVHQDSWDLATGATDNGVAALLAMEVLRIQASKVPLKRSLRVVLFSGEEQRAVTGSKAYIARAITRYRQ